MPNITKITKRKLGEILVNEGLLTPEQLQQGLAEQQQKGGLLGENLISLGFVSEMDIAAAMCTQFNLPYLDASRYNINKDVFNLIGASAMKQFVVLDRIGSVIIIAISAPLSEKTIQELEEKTSCQIFAFVSTNSQVKQSIEAIQGKGG